MPSKQGKGLVKISEGKSTKPRLLGSSVSHYNVQKMQQCIRGLPIASRKHAARETPHLGALRFF